jgi:hypothetical protein
MTCIIINVVVSMKLNAKKYTYLNILRLEVFEVDQGTLNSSQNFPNEKENNEEDFEGIGDEVSTNEMQGSSILSME